MPVDRWSRRHGAIHRKESVTISSTKRAEPRRERPKRMVTPTFWVITLSTFAYFVSVGAIIPVLPRYAKGPLAGGDISVGLAIGAFALAAVMLRPFVGRLSDRRGRTILMVGGAAIVGAATAGYTLAGSIPMLIALRLLTGAGEAGFYVGAATAINDLAPDERRGEALSFFSLALFSGMAVGPVVGELVLGDGNFAAVWLVSAASAGLSAALALKVPDTRPETEISDEKPPLIHPAGLVPGAVLGTIVCGLAGFDSFVPLYSLQLGLDGSRLVFVLFSVIVIAIRFFGARVPDRYGRHRVARVGLLGTASGLGIIALWQSIPGLFVGTAVFSIGHALSFPALMSLAVMAAPASERGGAIGTFTMFFDLAFGLGAIGLGLVAEATSYQGVFVAATGSAAAGFLLLIAYGRRTGGDAEQLAPVPPPERLAEPKRAAVAGRAPASAHGELE